MRVRTRVHVRGKHGESAVLAPGDTVPDWATVTNPDVIEADAVILPAPAPEPAPAAEPEQEPEQEAAPEPETPAAPAPRKRTSRKTAPASE